MKTEIFKVKVINWFNHNPTKKKTYKKTMISNSLPYDAKINALPLSNNRFKPFIKRVASWSIR